MSLPDDAKMEALRYFPEEKKLSLVTMPVPKIERPNQVLVEVKSSGLCGTDLHIVQGKFGNTSSEPVTLGHEFAGIVVQCGKEAAKKLKVGARVGVNPNSYCFACDFCNNGDLNHCENGGTRAGLGVFKDGGFAKYALATVELCFELKDNMTFDQGSLCEPISCLLHGWNRLQRFGSPQPDSRVFILGAGIIGNLWAAIFHHHGIRDVTITEPFEKRRQLSAKLVKDAGYKIMSPTEAEEILPKTAKGGELNGIDIVVDCTGHPPALEAAVKWMKRGGTICVYGCAAPGATMSLCPEELFSKELVIFGAQINPFTYKRAVSLASSMADAYLDMEKLGVQIFRLEDYQNALERLRNGSISKAMFNI